MTTLNAQYPSLLDLAKSTGADGRILRTAEILSKLSPLIGDLGFREANQGLIHRVQVQTTLPSVSSRRFNQRVLPTKGTTDQADEACTQIVDYADVDCSIADLNGNTADFRLLQAQMHLQAMAIEFERQLWYGNSAVVQEELDGLIPRLAAAGDTVIDAGGAGSDNASIILVCHSMSTVYGITPKGLQGGIRRDDKGRVTSENSSGLIDVYRDRFELNAGVAVEDYRYLAALRAIDVSTVVADTDGSTTNLINMMLQLTHAVYNIDNPMIKPIFYMNRSIASALDIQCVNKPNALFKAEEVEGTRKLSMRGIPIHISDGLTETESTI